MQRASEMPVILHLLLTEGSMGVCFKIIVFCCLENPMDGGDLGLIPGLKRFPGEGNGNLL